MAYLSRTSSKLSGTVPVPAASATIFSGDPLQNSLNLSPSALRATTDWHCREEEKGKSRTTPYSKEEGPPWPPSGERTDVHWRLSYWKEKEVEAGVKDYGPKEKDFFLPVPAAQSSTLFP